MSQQNESPSVSNSHVASPSASVYDATHVRKLYWTYIQLVVDIDREQEILRRRRHPLLYEWGDFLDTPSQCRKNLSAHIDLLWKMCYLTCRSLVKEFEKPEYQKASGAHQDEVWKQKLMSTVNFMEMMERPTSTIPVAKRRGRKRKADCIPQGRNSPPKPKVTRKGKRVDVSGVLNALRDDIRMHVALEARGLTASRHVGLPEL